MASVAPVTADFPSASVVPPAPEKAQGAASGRAAGLEVQHERTSDLLGSLVGQSARPIAAAFRHAADDRAFLTIDEANSLRRDRQGGLGRSPR